MVNFSDMICDSVDVRFLLIWEKLISEETIIKVESSALNHDGSILAVVGNFNYLLLISTNNFEIIKIIDLPSKDQISVCFHPIINNIAIGNRNNDILIINIEDSIILKKLSGHNNKVESLKYTKDGKYFISTGDKSSIDIWNCIDYNLEKTIKFNFYEKLSDIFDFDLTDNNNFIVSGSHFSKIDISYFETGLYFKPLIDDQMEKDITDADLILKLKFSPDSKYLVSGHFDFVIKIWDFENKKVLKTIPAHRSFISALSFNNLGTLLASGGNDTVVRIWNMKTFELIGEIRDLSGKIIGIHFSKDDKNLICIDSYGYIVKYNQVKL